jgi:D-threo-aldose 1-dehydrogenase
MIFGEQTARRSATTVNDLQQSSGEQLRAPQRRFAAREAALGFGCASLYGLPAKRHRRALLESAYELGIRHFDVAPIYGLGLAEAELAEFIGNRTDIRVATKFGRGLTLAGRLAGLAQSPIRRVLQFSPALRAKVRGTGDIRGTGIPDRILYSDDDCSADSARLSLMASLETLRVERIEYFLLHEPASVRNDTYRGLVDYLEMARSSGLIGHWGPAGDMSHMDADLTRFSDRATVHQFPYDLIRGYHGPQPGPGRATITFGFIAAALPRVQTLLAHQPNLRQQCSELLDADLMDQRAVVKLLVRDALTHNQFGTVLISSTKVGNLRMLCEAADTPLRNEAEVSRLIRQECLHTSVP